MPAATCQDGLDGSSESYRRLCRPVNADPRGGPVVELVERHHYLTDSTDACDEAAG
jgi:hypothetical protein